MNRKRVGGALFVVLLLAALGALLLARGGAGGVDARGPPAPSTPPPSKAPGTVSTPKPAPAPSGHAAPLRLVPATTSSPDASAAHGAFEGRVVSATRGEGVDGAELTFALEGGGASSVRAGKDGRFRFLPGASGTYQLAVVTAKGYLPFGPEWGQSPIRLTASPGLRLSDIVLALLPEVELVGRVESPEGKPVPGARIRVLTGRVGESVLFPTAEAFTSDAAGEFRFHAPEGTQVEARHPHHASARAEVTPSVALSRRLVLTLGARGASASGAPPQALAGRVVDARSAPVPGALVTVRSAASTWPTVHGDRLGEQVLTDGEGRFRLEGLEPGTYDVSANLLGLAPALLRDVPAGREDLELTLARGTRLVGSVRDAASGAPVPSFSVGVMLRVGPLQRDPVTQLSFIDPQGRYEVAGLSPGGYVVQLVAPGYAPAERLVEVPPGATEPVRADFTLSRGARLRGRVVEAGSQRPIERARVSVEGLTDSGSLSVRFDALTDARGEFTLEGLPPRGVSLYVAADGHHGRILSGITPSAEASVPRVIELRKTEPGEEPQVELVGIGAVLAAREDALVLGEVMPGGGAAEAGLRPGDGIVHIDGEPVVALGFPESIGRIRGPENSRVVLGVRRGPAGDAGPSPVVHLPVTRRRIQR